MDYCDMREEWSYANESISDIGTEIKEKLHSVTSRMDSWLKGILANSNYFKEARLDPQMNKDLLQVLRISQPRTDINFKPIASYYNTMNKKKDGTQTSQVFSVRTGGTPGQSHTTSLLQEVEKSTIDIDESLKAARKSKEYERATKNKYFHKKLEPIPLGIIINDMKKTSNSLTFFNKELVKLHDFMNKLKTKDPTPGVVTITNRMNVWLHKVTEYFRFRISVLEIYFKRAKASLTLSTYGMNRSVKETEETRTKGSTKREGISITFDVKTPAEAEEIKELYAKACKAETYAEYKPIYDKLSTILNCKGKNIEALKVVGLTVSGVFAGSDHPTSVPLSGRMIYHHSTNGSLTELEPRFRDQVNTLFPEPRVYFHINFATDRYGAKVKEGTYVYVPENLPQMVYKDGEMRGTACYVVSDKPIKIKKVDFNKIRDSKLKKIDLDFNKSQKV